MPIDLKHLFPMGADDGVDTEIEQEPANSSPVTLEDALLDLLDHANADEPAISALPCGIALLDDTTGGLVRGEYLGIIGAPGIGKSTIADAILLSALRKNEGTTGLVFALETSIPVRCARLLVGSAVTLDTRRTVTECLVLDEVLAGCLSEQSKRLANRTVASLVQDIGIRLTFIDNMHDAGAIAEAIRERRPDFVIVDHLGLVCADSMGGSSSLDRFDSALNAVAGAIREANACAILIAEVSKAGLMDGSVDLSAVRGSARFASLAGQMVGIKREVSQPAENMQLLVQLHKNRYGRGSMQQKAVLFGGLSYVGWHEVIEIATEQLIKRRGSGNVE
jgi:predicted ATP-dependent serine protease